MAASSASHCSGCIQRRVRERAEAKRYTVGEVVTAALEAWLEAPQGIAQSQNTLALEDLAARLAEIQARLDVIEQLQIGRAR